MPLSVDHVTICRVTANTQQLSPDLLAVEEPLEIRVGFGELGFRQERPLTITMRTPGSDLELAAGFLITEGIVGSMSDIVSIKHCERVEKPEQRGNVVRVELSPALPFDFSQLERHFYTSSSCGVCGKSSIEAVRATACHPLPQPAPMIEGQLIHTLPDLLRKAQAVFEYTGGLHAAGLFNSQGKLLLMREDVGRHNALDKLVGAAAQQGWLPLSDLIIQVSGRLSFELVQKTMVAGAPLLAAVGAPSSLAVKLADQAGMTLLGFVRNGRYNIYTYPERIMHKQPVS